MHEIFICSYDSSGNFRWGKSYGGNKMDQGYGIACDKANNVYVTGDFQSFPMTFDSYTIPNISGQYNYFLAKYDPMGNILWLKSDSGQAGGYCIITDDFNDLYWSGHFYSNDVVIDTITLQQPAISNDPIFIAKLDSSGNVYWAKELGSGGDDNNGLSLGNNGDIYFSGDFYGVKNFIVGNDTMPLTGVENAFIAKLGFTNLVALFNATDNVICPGTCTGFTNNSVNAQSYLWLFPGSSTPSSTDVSPVGICYNTPGQYDMTLIATSAAGSDTLTLQNYITVYPFPPAQGIIQSGDTLLANAGAVSYQWYFNTILIPGATGYFYVAEASGDFNVIATDVNGCEVEAVINDVIASTSPLSNGQGVRVYPNPAVNTLYIQLGDQQLHEPKISIYDLPGERILTPAPLLTGNNLVVDVSAIEPGLYLIEITSSENILRMKFLKQ
jgi:PKD repeat protein